VEPLGVAVMTNDSVGSVTQSDMMSTEKVLEVSPGPKTRLPDAAV
jgi:hypothetical protein